MQHLPYFMQWVMVAVMAGADPSLAVQIAISPDPALVLAISWEESRLDRGVVSRVGACGPMQVLPKYSRFDCKELAGDLGVLGGWEALEYWRGRSRTLEQALAHYNGGNKPGKRARAYAKRVLKWRRNLVGPRNSRRNQDGS